MNNVGHTKLNVYGAYQIARLVTNTFYSPHMAKEG